MRGSLAARRSRISEVPSVEQSSTITSSRSIFSGKGAARTRDRHLSTTVRSLYTGIRMERSIRLQQYNWKCFPNMNMSLNTPVLETNIPSLTLRGRGKVRDIYEDPQHPERLLIVATDRISAFDYILATGIPDKGRVLTQMSLFWFDFLKDTVPNHLLSTDMSGLPAELEGRSMWVKRADMFDVECVARGYLSGSGWKEYQQTGAVCGIKLPPGLRESDALPEPIFTPATKAQTGHDENISFERMVSIVGEELSTRLRDLTLKIYRQAVEYARPRG